MNIGHQVGSRAKCVSRHDSRIIALALVPILVACGGARQTAPPPPPPDAVQEIASVAVAPDTTVEIDSPPDFVASRWWDVVDADSFEVLVRHHERPRAAPVWRDEETPSGSLPGVALEGLGSSRNALQRLRAMPAPTRTFRDTDHGPTTERWSWGDTLSIAFSVDADRLTALEWSSDRPEWPAIFGDLGAWGLVENGTLGPEWYGPILGAGRSGRGPLLRAIPIGNRLGLLTVSYTWPGPADS